VTRPAEESITKDNHQQQKGTKQTQLIDGYLPPLIKININKRYKQITSNHHITPINET
jgi:hypothetical protein